MKKIVTGILILASTLVFAGKGPNWLNIGMGLGNGYGHRYNSGWKSGYTSSYSYPGIGLSAEWFIKDEMISLGPYLSWSRSGYRNDNWNYYKKNYSNVWLGIRGALYIDDLVDLNKNFDLYLAGSVGYYIYSVKEYSQFGDVTLGYSDTYFPVSGLAIGGRYHFNDKASLFLEGGWGWSYTTIGLSIKL